MAAAVLRVPYVRVLAGYDPNIRRPRQQVNLSFIENRIPEICSDRQTQHNFGFFAYQTREGSIMRKVSVIVYILGLTVLLFASNSFAIGLGMYVDLGGGSGEAEFDFQGAEEFDIDTNLFGIGFQLETKPLTGKRVFSYRLQVGLEARDIEIEDDENVTLELGGLVINNTFAFGGNPSEKIRLWGGPQVLIGFYGGETDKEYLGDEISFSGAAFGLGIAGGANFGVGSGKTILTTTIGVRTLGFSGDAKWYNEDEELNGAATEFFLSVGIFF
jgi:hypothetical protein